MPVIQMSNGPVQSDTYQHDWEVNNWRHRITARIGFDTASFTILGEKYTLEDLWNYALGRKITRYSPDGHFVIWEGQVIEMVLREPGIQKRISLRDMINRAYVRYIPTDTTTNPPTYSAETSTTAADDTTSQGLYGVKSKSFTPRINKITNTNASQQANVILQQYRQPKRAADIGKSNDVGLDVVCEGYGNTLDWKIYNQTANSGTQDADLEISDIYTSAGQFLSAKSLSSNSGTQIKKYFNEDQTALKIIQDIAALGDTSYNRWLIQVLEGRILYYRTASTSVAYYRRMNDSRQEFKNLDGRVIPYWEIRPDNWVRTVDVYPHTLTPALLADDKQATYIEAVDWAEPDDLSISGSTGDTSQVLIARLSGQGDVLL